MKKNQKTYLLFIALLFCIYSCKKEKEPSTVSVKVYNPPIDTSTPSTPPVRTCTMYKPTIDFSLREGKWLEIQTPFDAQHSKADTIWFKNDSLMAWSFQGDPYLETKMFFGKCNLLFHRDWNNPTQNSSWYYFSVLYNDTTGVFSLVSFYSATNDTISYKRLR